MKAPALLLLASLVAGCNSQTPAVSEWQRFDALQPVLALVTSESYRVATDLEAVNHAMSIGSRGGVRGAAVRAKLDALQLSGHAGGAGYHLRLLRKGALNAPTQRRYLSVVLSALSEQWWEGRWVESMAEVIWADPLLISPHDVARIIGMQRRADRSASAAVASCRQAAMIRQDDPVSFRYVPVRVAGPPGGARM